MRLYDSETKRVIKRFFTNIKKKYNSTSNLFIGRDLSNVSSLCELYSQKAVNILDPIC